MIDATMLASYYMVSSSTSTWQHPVVNKGWKLMKDTGAFGKGSR